jgi:hypothetical protein
MSGVKEPTEHSIPKPTVIYVAGYGRSGSTILDILLGSLPQVTSLGEVGNLWELYFRDDSRCSCGLAYFDCPFWSQVIARLDLTSDASAFADYRRVSGRFQDWKRLWRLFADRGPAEKQTYGHLATRLYTAAALANGKSFIVDSSKSSYPYAWRALALRRLAGLDVHVIHLVRNGLAVMASKQSGNNRKLSLGVEAREPWAAYRGLAGWLIANACVVFTRWFLPDNRYLLLRYEDLIAHPEETMKRLGEFLGLDVTPVVRRIMENRTFEVGHLVAGNRLVRQGRIHLQRNLQPANGLAWHHRLAYHFLAWPMRLYATLAGFRGK